jgi:hypothetical protein
MNLELLKQATSDGLTSEFDSSTSCPSVVYSGVIFSVAIGVVVGSLLRLSEIIVLDSD